MARRLTETGFIQAVSRISRNEHLPTRIAGTIGQEIIKGRITPGEKLPAEYLLAKSFGVSRSVVREAIAQLQNEGLVETRQGVGAFATGFPHGQFLRIERDELNDKEAIRRLYQLRIPLESRAAGLAAMLHTEDDLVNLNHAFQRMADVKNAEQEFSSDLAFHRAIATATQNHYFPLFIGFICQRISVAIKATEVVQEITKATIAEHAEIRDALGARDAIRAQQAMRLHLIHAAERLGLALER